MQEVFIALKQLIKVNSWVANNTHPSKLYLYGTQSADQHHYGNQEKKKKKKKKKKTIEK